MKVKNIFRTVLAAVAIVAAFSGCSNLFDKYDDDSSSSQKGRLLFSASSSARTANTVNPTAFNFSSDSGLTFTLTGTISGGANQTLGTWSDSESKKAYSRMTSDTSVLVDVGSWTFRLSVTKNGGEVLYGTKTLTVNAGNNSLNFGTLSEASAGNSEIEVAKGSVNVTLSFPSDSGVKGAAASLTALGSEETGSEKSFEVTTSSVTYSATEVDAGTYILAIKLYSDSETKDGTTYLNTYTALVNVAPGCESKGSASLTDINTLYTIKYELNDGSFAGTVQTSYNKHAKITLPTPTRNGYTFKGWSKTSNNAETADYTDGKVISISEDTTLYALWDIITYSITYNYDSNTTNASDAVTSYTVETETFSLPTPTTTTTTNVAGFGGWFTTESFDSGTKLAQVEKGTYGNLTLYAKWLTWPEYISGLTEDSTVYVTGELTEDLLKEIAAAIKSGNYMVTLDLSNTTGLTTISDAVFYNQRIFYQNYKILSIVLPSSLTQIGEYAFFGCSLVSVTIPASVTSIGKGAFSSCTSLASVTISDGVTSIGNAAFSGCTSLVSVTIPASITSIGGSAFSSCTSLEKITVSDNNTVFDSRDGCNAIINTSTNTLLSGCKSTVIPASVTSIGDNAFSGCSLVSVTIPASVTSIGSGAFKSCTSLASVTIPASVTSIGSDAFCECTSLKSITIPDKVTSIGDFAFGYTRLKSITIPASVKSIGSGAFKSCTSLASVTISDGVTSIGDCMFESCTSLASITIPASVTSIEFSAFKSCTSLASVTISDGVTSIESYAFWKCTGLESITIPASVKSIGNYAFSNCTGLASITILDSVTSIGDYAFSGCTSLANITIPGSVTSIGQYTFSGCANLKSVTIGDGVTSIGANVFSSCPSLEEITIPFVGGSKNAAKASASTLFGYIFSSSEYDKSSLGTEYNSVLQYYSADAHMWYYIPIKLKKVTVTGGNILYGAFSECPRIESVTLSGNVTSIGDSAFVGCTKLESVTIGNSVEKIGNHAFSGCPIASITIPDSVTSIGDYAFISCTGLASVTISDGVTSIGRSAFYHCTSLSRIAIPASVTSIGSYAFCECTSLSRITIPDSVTSIGSSAFSSCTKLESVTIGSSVEKIGYDAFYKCSALTEATFKDTTTWYYTSSSSYTKGTKVNVSDASIAAKYLKSTYTDRYWYKK